MSADIPTRAPRSFVAGETVSWSSTFPDFPASVGWELRHYLRGPGPGLDVLATADGDDFTNTIAAIDSAKLVGGDYSLQSWISKGSGDEVERYQVGAREIIVKTPLLGSATDQAIETRSAAKIIVDNIDTYLQQIKTGGTAAIAVASYKIADRETQHYTLDELVKLRTYYWNIYVGEKRKGKEFRNIRCAF